MNVVATVVVVAFGLILIAFAGVVFVRPVIAERLLAPFASSARAHYVEQVFRLVISAALIALSPAMWQPQLFWVVGWAIVISSVALICAPWQWHHRFGQLIRPMFGRYLRLYAVASFAFGALLLYGVFAGGGAA
jgi:hypothetical protein